MWSAPVAPDGQGKALAKGDHHNNVMMKMRSPLSAN
jgi:hypothetical protein